MKFRTDLVLQEKAYFAVYRSFYLSYSFSCQFHELIKRECRLKNPSQSWFAVPIADKVFSFYWLTSNSYVPLGTSMIKGVVTPLPLLYDGLFYERIMWKYRCSFSLTFWRTWRNRSSFFKTIFYVYAKKFYKRLNWRSVSFHRLQFVSMYYKRKFYPRILTSNKYKGRHSVTQKWMYQLCLPKSR